MQVQYPLLSLAGFPTLREVSRRKAVKHEIDCLAGSGDGGLDRKEETRDVECYGLVENKNLDDKVGGTELIVSLRLDAATDVES